MSEPVVETSNQPVLRREAILPRERRGGLGAVALLCSLAGVASGFALATTILATHIAASEARAMRRFAPAELEVGPYLGVRYDPLTSVVSRVEPNSPAARVGLLPDDRIVRLEGELLDQPKELGRLMRTHTPGDVITLEVQRGPAKLMVRPTVGQGLISPL